jgi:protein TonB
VSATEPTAKPAANAALPVAAQAASIKATGRTNSNRSGASKGETNRYFGEIMAWLSKHKRYPVELKKKKKQGVVTVEFSIDRNGYLLSARVKKGSDYPELDAAAMAMLSNASPLPAMPDWMDRQTLTLSIPVEYSLITNSSFKE